MSFELDLTDPATSTRSIVEGQCDRALHALKTPHDFHAVVHEARKRAKRIRAVIRLVRDAAPEDYGRTNVRLRDAARQVSAVRDATAAIETCDELQDWASPEELDDLVHLRAALGIAREGIVADTDAAQCLADLRDAFEWTAHATDAWDLDRLGAATWAAGASRTYRRGCKALEAVEDPQSVEALHELRKRSKYSRFQHHLLRSAWPDAMRARQAGHASLADILGDHHDLAMLRQQLGTLEHYGPPASRRIDELAVRRMTRLHAEVVDLAARVYAERPKAFERRTRAWLEAASPDARK